MKNCSTCSHCIYIHEYEMYFCEEHKQPIFGSLAYGLCTSYEEYKEEDEQYAKLFRK